MLLKVFVLIFLAFVIIQDFKYRAVSWIIFPIGFILFIINAFVQISVYELIIHCIINWGILLLLILSISIYTSIKNKKITNIINKGIGIGDILFFAVISVYFSMFNYVFFLSVSFLISLLVFSLITVFSKKKNITVPLAGMSAIVLIVFQIFSIFSEEINSYDDYFIINNLFFV